jgi:hypothetical protein
MDGKPQTSRPLAALQGLLVAISAAFLAAFAYVVARRLAWPFENEWLEGDELHHAWRILQGLAWYPPPSVEFFPNVYTPGYPAVCAALMAVFGESLALMRAVSVAATGAIVILIGLVVHRRTRSLFCAAVAGGVFLASFEVCGAWFDVARVDMLAAAVALGGIALVGRDSSAAAFYPGAALLGLSYFFKQTNAALIVGTAVVWLFWDWRRALRLIAVLGAVVAVGALALQRASDGWYAFYTTDVPSAAPVLWDRLWKFASADLFRLAGFLLPVLAVGVALALGKRRADALPLQLLPFAVAASVVPRLSPGGYDNVFVTAAIFVAVGTGLSLGAIAAAPAGVSRHAWAALLLVLFHFAARAYDPRDHTAGRGDRELAVGLAAVERIRELPGPTLCPYHPYLLHLAGRPAHMSFHMLNELRIQERNRPEYERLRDEVGRLFEQARWRSYVSTQVEGGGELFGGFDHFPDRRFRYRPGPPLVAADDAAALYPATGNPVRPYRVYLDPAFAPPGAPLARRQTLLRR